MHFVIWFRHLGFDRLDAFIGRAKSLGLGLYPVHPYYRTRLYVTVFFGAMTIGSIILGQVARVAGLPQAHVVAATGAALAALATRRWRL